MAVLFAGHVNVLYKRACHEGVGGAWGAVVKKVPAS